jgi:hypothetical protein
MLYLSKSRHPLRKFCGDFKRSFNGRVLEWFDYQRVDKHTDLFQGLSRLKSLCPDGKAVIACNGPSINESNPSIYTKYPLIGLNFGALMNEEHISSYICHVLADQLLLTQNLSKIPLLPGLKLVYFRNMHLFRSIKDHYFYAHSPDSLPSLGLSPFISSFGNSTSIAAQLLFMSGIRKVAVIGLDHDYGSGYRPLELRTSTDFASSYAQPSKVVLNQNVQAPDLIRVEYNLRNLYHLYDDNGGILVNCSERSKLSVLPKLSLEEFDRC